MWEENYKTKPVRTVIWRSAPGKEGRAAQQLHGGLISRWIMHWNCFPFQKRAAICNLKGFSLILSQSSLLRILLGDVLCFWLLCTLSTCLKLSHQSVPVVIIVIILSPSPPHKGLGESSHPSGSGTRLAWLWFGLLSFCLFVFVSHGAGKRSKAGPCTCQASVLKQGCLPALCQTMHVSYLSQTSVESLILIRRYCMVGPQRSDALFWPLPSPPHTWHMFICTHTAHKNGRNLFFFLRSD